MPQTRSRWSAASRSNGQLARTRSSSTFGSYPNGASAAGDPVELAGATAARPVGGGVDGQLGGCVGRRGDRLVHRGAVQRALDGVGQHLPGQVVAAVRQADRHLAGRAPVELGRTPGARAGASGEPAELGDQQALVDEPVEVELRGVLGDLDTLGRLLAAHRPRLVGDEAVERAAYRVGEGRQRRHPTAEGLLRAPCHVQLSIRWIACRKPFGRSTVNVVISYREGAPPWPLPTPGTR